MNGSNFFQIGFSADFRDDRGNLVFPDLGLDLLERDAGVRYEFLPEYQAEYTADQLAPYDVMISLKPRVTAASLRGVQRLAAIGRCGVGYDNVDVNACTEADVALYTTPVAVRRPMAESIVLFILALSHDLVRKDRMVREGRWKESTRLLGREPRGRVLGTVGLGGIASELLFLLQPFGFARLLTYDPFMERDKAWQMGVAKVELDELLRTSDYVLINCPLTAQTRRLIGARELALMKPTAFLINTARGPIVDEAALADTLARGAIRGAALDVFETEPLPPESPLCRLENVILTSHSVGWTEELFRDMGRADCEGALAIYRGEAPASVINREVLERPGFRAKLARAKGSAA
jgi:phosphoglycerate dehydrogenase-like enzyme